MPARALEAVRRAPEQVRWLALITVVLLVAEAVAAAVAQVYDYDRWDNFEYYTPMIAAAHRALLSGQLPMWNPHQHLGEPFITNPQMGTFYPPYTLAYLAVAGLSLSLPWLCAIISVSHAIVGAWGSFTLLRHLGARASLACVGALGMATGGYLRSVEAVWVFVGPTFAWLPWTLWAAARLLEGSRRARHGLVFVAGLTAQAYIGHPQIWLYVWLCVGLCCAGYALVVEAPWRAVLRAGARLGVHAVAAAALGALTMLPVLMQSRHTARKVPVRFADFVHTSASLESLLGLLLPLYRATHDFIVEEPCSFLLHQGAWLLPALALGALLWVRLELRRGADRALGRRALVFALVGGLFLVFALGKNTPIYGLTYALPVWSSFRWPHKFLIVALPCLGVAGALGLELVARSELGWRWRAAAAAALLVLLGALAARVGWADAAARPLGVAGLIAGGVSALGAPFVHLRSLRAALVVASSVSGVVLIALAQWFTPNAIAGPHTLDTSSFGWAPDYRVLPVDRHRTRSQITERLLFTSATLLGVDSVTGCTTAMAPEWYTAWLKSDAWGLLPDATYRQLLPSHFLRSLNVRYVVATTRDRTVTRWLAANRFVLERKLGSIAHYEVPDALPRAYFASEVHEFTPDSFREGLWLNQADRRAAYVEGASGAFAGAGEVTRADFGRAERPRLEVESPSGGFLVVSMSFTPDWRVFVDGVESTLSRTNAMLQGVQVPAGQHVVELRYDNPAFRWGVGSSAFGALVLLAASLPLGRPGEAIRRRWRARRAPGP